MALVAPLAAGMLLAGCAGQASSAEPVHLDELLSEARLAGNTDVEIDALRRTALFHHGAEWAVYAVEGNRARLMPVVVGHQSPQEAEVLSGISQGTRVVLHPGDAIADGVRVRPRASL